MTTVTPVNQRATVAGHRVDEIDSDGPIPAGVFEFCSDNNGPNAGILFGCPCGCGEMHVVQFRADHRPMWNWNGDREAPTLTPSIAIRQMDGAGNVIGDHWHGFLTNGEWRSC